MATWGLSRCLGAALRRPPFLVPEAATSLLGGVASASSSASKTVRKKKQKMRYSSHTVPNRTLRQKDGDFPVQVRPSRPPDIRDLQDSALDAEASGFDRARLPKPHEVREAVRQGLPTGPVGTVDDKVRLAALQHRRTQVPEVAAFDPEKGMKEEDAADLAALKARALARRNYKWIPNPYGPKPGVLGTDPEAEAKYYSQYFDGRRLPQDKRQANALEDEELKTEGRPRPRRERISPKRFWYKPDYVTPEPSSVAFMNSRELKYAMVNEAHVVRKWRGEQPEGPAAGLPPGTSDLWMAFGYRAAEVATGRGAADTALPGAGGDSGAGAQGRLPVNRCSLSTTLRFLQALASVQAGPYSALQQLTSRVLEHSKDMRPQQCFFLLQALSRLRLKHPKVVWILERMSLSWRTLPDKKFVKAANAVAKLDLGSNLWARPLKLALANSLARLPAPHLANIKAITVMELLDDHAAMRAYLESCEQTRSELLHPRHLQVVEMHVHLVHPDLWEVLDEPLRLFLQEVRAAAERAREEGRQQAKLRRTARSSAPSSGSDSGEDGEDSSGSESDSEDERDGRGYARRGFSSPLHEDVSRVLGRVMGVEHQNALIAGPYTLDVCHVPTMTVIEAAARWQFYLRSPQMTALARRRQELLRAMGFQVVQVPYHRWDALQDDEAKVAFLKERLPSGILPRQGVAAGASTSAGDEQRQAAL